MLYGYGYTTFDLKEPGLLSSTQLKVVVGAELRSSQYHKNYGYGYIFIRIHIFSLGEFLL